MTDTPSPLEEINALLTNLQETYNSDVPGKYGVFLTHQQWVSVRDRLQDPPKQPPKKRSSSRFARWQDAVSDARSAIDEAESALRSSFESLQEIQQEYMEWRDSLPESLQSSAVGEKLDAVCDLDLDSPLTQLDDISTTIDEAEGLDLPRGFGKD